MVGATEHEIFEGAILLLCVCGYVKGCGYIRGQGLNFEIKSAPLQVRRDCSATVQGCSLHTVSVNVAVAVRTTGECLWVCFFIPSQCSKTCSTGLRFREVKCYQGEALGQGCDPASKPEARMTCQLQLCPTDTPGKEEDFLWNITFLQREGVTIALFPNAHRVAVKPFIKERLPVVELCRDISW